ncbi:MAG: 4-hydroxy-tetrahydrodipicolinate reductase [Dehalococcoidia bacterium]
MNASSEEVPSPYPLPPTPYPLPSAPSIRVVVSGAGKMGREIIGGLCREPDIDPVGVLEKFSGEDLFSLPDGSGRLIPRSSEPALLNRVRPDVLVDFSHHEWTAQVVPLAIELGVRPVIGTTSLPEALIQRFANDCAAAKLGGLIAANFALGAVLLMHLAGIAAPFFDNVEVIELHHDQKVDAPSGTAGSILQALLAGRNGKPFNYPETTKQTLPGTRGGEYQGAAVHSVRLPGLVAHHEVIFGSTGQILTLRHDSTSRESFLPGVLLAVREVMKRQELVQGLDRLLGLTS